MRMKKAKTRKTRKRLTPLGKIRKELTKLEALHAKEEAIVEKINAIIEEEGNIDVNEDWEGTD